MHCLSAGSVCLGKEAIAMCVDEVVGFIAERGAERDTHGAKRFKRS
jgi:hypothetical protein